MEKEQANYSVGKDLQCYTIELCAMMEMHFNYTNMHYRYTNITWPHVAIEYFEMEVVQLRNFLI